MDILGSGKIQGVSIPHTRVKIKGNSSQFDIICVYIRDGELTTEDLVQLNKISGAIVLGDFNAKHQDIHIRKIRAITLMGEFCINS